MTDSEIRGIVLRKYYDRRRDGSIQLLPRDFGNVIAKADILHVSCQLAEYNLIVWLPMVDGKGQPYAGKGHISASGIDVVEKNGEGAPLNLVLPLDTRLQLNLDRVVSAIDRSPATDAEKDEVRKLFAAFLGHPVMRALLSPDKVDRLVKSLFAVRESVHESAAL